MSNPPPLPRVPPTDWWGRNWKRVVPILCVMAVLMFVGLFAGISALIKSSDAYTGALARVKASPAVADALGSPLKEGFFLQGSVNETNDSGRAELAIPMSGPKGSGTVVVRASRVRGVWYFNVLQVEVDGSGKRIDLSERRNMIPESTSP